MSVKTDLAQTVPIVALCGVFLLKSRLARQVVSSIFIEPKLHTIIVRHADRQINIEAARSGEVEETVSRILAMKTVPTPRMPVNDVKAGHKRGRHRTTKQSEP